MDKKLNIQQGKWFTFRSKVYDDGDRMIINSPLEGEFKFMVINESGRVCHWGNSFEELVAHYQEIHLIEGRKTT